MALLTENTNLLSILLIHLNSDGTLDEVDSKSNDLLVNRPNKVSGIGCAEYTTQLLSAAVYALL